VAPDEAAAEDVDTEALNLSPGSTVVPGEMEDIRTTSCPFCAESIKEDAVRCPYCRSRLDGRPRYDLYRNRSGNQLAGVSVALAKGFELPVTFVRLGFIVLTFVSFIGPILYAALWVILPYEQGGASPLGSLIDGDAGQPSIFERLLNWVEIAIEKGADLFRAKTDPTTPSSSAPATPPNPVPPETPAEGAH